MKCFERTNVKEKSEEQELTGREVARKIAKESGRGLKKVGENGAEQCHEVELVKQNGDETIPHNVLKQREKKLEKGGEIPENFDSEDYRTSRINSRNGINVQPCQDSRIIHQMVHKNNQTWFVRVFRKLQNSKHSGKSG